MNNLSTELARLSTEQRKLFKLLLAEQGVDLTQMPVERRCQPGPAPLSFTQERLWTLSKRAVGTAWGNVPLALEIEGPLNVECLIGGLKELVCRHEALRTRFIESAGSTVQICEPEVSLAVVRTGFEDLPEGERPRALERRLTEAARRPLDPTKAPLFRAELIRLAETRHVLLLVLHHLVADGLAIRLLLQELSALYRTTVAGMPPSPPEAGIEYADFAIWQREWLVAEMLESQIAYWRKQLAGSAALELPWVKGPSGSSSYEGASMAFTLPAPLSQSLRELSRSEGVTLFMSLLAAFQALLHQYTGQTDVAVAAAISNRNRPETERVIGNFANNLLLRVDLSGDPPFREMLARVRGVVTEAFGHQDLPLELLANDLSGDEGSLPPVRAIFILRNGSVERMLDLPGLVVRRLATETGAAGLDLSLDISDGADELSGTLEYRTQLVSGGTVARLIQQYQRLLEAVSADPGLRLSKVPLPLSLFSQAYIATQERVSDSVVSQNCVLAEVNGFGHRLLVPPRNDVERKLVQIWHRLLGVDTVGVRDNFFELGGHSLQIAQLLAAIEQAFGSSPPAASLFEPLTIENLAGLIARDRPPGSDWVSLQLVKPDGGRLPFIAIHAGDGFYDALGRHLHLDQPFYVLTTRSWLDSSSPPFHPCTCVEEMATRYLERLRAFRPHGPYLLGGTCLGGLVAYDMARRLVAEGEKVPLLCVFDALHFATRDESLGTSIGARGAAHFRSLARLRFTDKAHYVGARVWATLRCYLRSGRETTNAAAMGAACAVRRMLRQPVSPEFLYERAMQTSARMLRNYSAKTYPGRLTVFVASGSSAGDFARWTQLVLGGVDWYQVPGTHASMLKEPHVQVLAEQLNACLLAAQAGRPRTTSHCE